MACNHLLQRKWMLFFSICLVLTACTTLPPPQEVDDICRIFKQYPRWHQYARDVESRWKVPIPIQMAIIHQESKFDGTARPARKKLLWVIPWRRPSTAYGYSQALNSTWALYKGSPEGGGAWASRTNFFDSVDFVGWYANQASIRAAIPRYDAYRLYLAYHEGIGGYTRKTYLAKPWLIRVAQKVKHLSQVFEKQLNQCPVPPRPHFWSR
ncbi:MAG: hypothetical protein H2069_08690 [Legionella sp.]|nr:hypothetical protein [Legionella sp.]